MTLTIRPFLMFQGQRAEEALRFYLSVFPGSTLDELLLYTAGQPGKEGSVAQARFTIGGQSVRCTDSPVAHAFDFTPSMSLFVDCESEEQLRHFASTLGAGGKELMPVGNYGFSPLFAWVNDRFGVSWQLNLPPR